MFKQLVDYSVFTYIHSVYKGEGMLLFHYNLLKPKYYTILINCLHISVFNIQFLDLKCWHFS